MADRATGMLTADWTGRRMLASGALRTIGARGWTLLRRLGARLDPTVSRASEPRFVSGIARLLGRILGASPDRPEWAFALDAPDPVSLILEAERSAETGEGQEARASRPAAVRPVPARRPGTRRPMPAARPFRPVVRPMGRLPEASPAPRTARALPAERLLAALRLAPDSGLPRPRGDARVATPTAAPPLTFTYDVATLAAALSPAAGPSSVPVPVDVPGFTAADETGRPVLSLRPESGGEEDPAVRPGPTPLISTLRGPVPARAPAHAAGLPPVRLAAQQPVPPAPVVAAMGPGVMRTLATSGMLAPAEMAGVPGIARRIPGLPAVPEAAPPAVAPGTEAPAPVVGRKRRGTSLSAQVTPTERQFVTLARPAEPAGEPPARTRPAVFPERLVGSRVPPTVPVRMAATATTRSPRSRGGSSRAARDQATPPAATPATAPAVHFAIVVPRRPGAIEAILSSGLPASPAVSDVVAARLAATAGGAVSLAAPLAMPGLAARPGAGRDLDAAAERTLVELAAPEGSAPEAEEAPFRGARQRTSAGGARDAGTRAARAATAFAGKRDTAARAPSPIPGIRPGTFAAPAAGPGLRVTVPAASAALSMIARTAAAAGPEGFVRVADRTSIAAAPVAAGPSGLPGPAAPAAAASAGLPVAEEFALLGIFAPSPSQAVAEEPAQSRVFPERPVAATAIRGPVRTPASATAPVRTATVVPRPPKPGSLAASLALVGPSASRATAATGRVPSRAGVGIPSATASGAAGSSAPVPVPGQDTTTIHDLVLEAPSIIEAELLAQPEARPLTGSVVTNAAPDLVLVQRTLARALSALAPLPGVTEGDVLSFLAGTGRPRRAAGASPAAAGPRRGPGEDGDRILVDAGLPAGAAESRSAVRPTAGRPELPGLPGREHGTDRAPEADFDLVSPAAATGSPASSRPMPSPAIPATAFPGSPAGTGPAYRGSLPLVAPALSAVAATAMMSRKAETRPAAAKPETVQAQAGDKGPPVDLDALAAEMTDRIARRLRRDKERRGFHG